MNINLIKLFMIWFLFDIVYLVYFFVVIIDFCLLIIWIGGKF